MDQIDRGRDLLVNFADYIFLRRVNLAWEECSSSEGLSKTKINCAFEITAPGRTLDFPEAK